MPGQRGLLRTLYDWAEHLGILYGAYVAIAALVATSVALARWFNKSPLLSSVFFYLAVVGTFLFVAFVPILAYWLRQKTPQPIVANPHLYIKSVIEEYTIGAARWKLHQRVAVTALRQGVDRYRFSFRLSGTAIGSVRCTRGELLGPVWSRDSARYEVKFDSPLAKNESAEFELTFDVDDKDGNIHPYVSTRATNAFRYGTLTQTITFDKAPQAVYSEVMHALTGQGIEPLKDLYPNKAGKYTWGPENVTFARLYTIGWRT